MSMPYSPIGWDIVVVDKEACELIKGARQGAGGIHLAVRLDSIQKDDEFRIVRGEIAEEGMQPAIGVVSSSARIRNLRSARFRRDRVMLLFQFPLQKRIVVDF